MIFVNKNTKLVANRISTRTFRYNHDVIQIESIYKNNLEWEPYPMINQFVRYSTNIMRVKKIDYHGNIVYVEFVGKGLPTSCALCYDDKFNYTTDPERAKHARFAGTILITIAESTYPIGYYVMTKKGLKGIIIANPFYLNIKDLSLDDALNNFFVAIHGENDKLTYGKYDYGGDYMQSGPCALVPLDEVVVISESLPSAILSSKINNIDFIADPIRTTHEEISNTIENFLQSEFYQKYKDSVNPTEKKIFIKRFVRSIIK